ncbi:putative hydroxypyruvate isomerase isoform X2 [Ambystoma mexicanum]|uniref:putative hydroxypyruvate isomerase isoform X2 n=1 Tax=Ambystoma mexicanum TaxID=8296 RepID=UPI0037E8C92C
MSMLQFSGNLSWLFPTLPSLPSRMQAAAGAGFRWVEVAWPYDWAPELLRQEAERNQLRVVLINTPPGDVKAGEMGLGAVPGRQEDFRKGLDLALQYAKALDCGRIHIMAGRVPAGLDRAHVEDEMEATFVENLNHAAAVLSQEGIIGLLEPINSRITDPRYFLNTPHQAAALLKKVGCDNLKLQMDVFHWQIMDGNLTQNLKTYLPLIGDTLEGLGWLRSYWKSRGIQDSGPGRPEPQPVVSGPAEETQGSSK